LTSTLRKSFVLVATQTPHVSTEKNGIECVHRKLAPRWLILRLGHAGGVLRLIAEPWLCAPEWASSTVSHMGDILIIGKQALDAVQHIR